MSQPPLPQYPGQPSHPGQPPRYGPTYPQAYPTPQYPNLHYPPPRRPPSAETRRDVEAALAAREELGADYDEHIAAGLAERVEELAAYRLAELRRQDETHGREKTEEQLSRSRQFKLAVISLVMAFPITGIAASEVEPGLVGIAVSWAGIVAVNAVYAISNRRRR
jgi:hypothetical protein